MSDPFSDAHRREEALGKKRDADAQQKAAASQIQARIAAKQAQAKRPANEDIGNGWKTFKHFWER
jgi:hypothetical protein